MKPLTNVDATTLADAVTRMSRPATAPVGGGSDLLGLIKDDLVPASVLVNLRTIAGLNAIQPADGGVRLGGLVTLAMLSRDPQLQPRYRVLAEAAASAATPQIRNVATLAGNICQRPWCWYFRQGFPCYKHGGTRCFSRVGENQFNAILGGGPSYIVHPSDTAPALVALDARIRIVGPEGDRWVPAAEFFVLPRVDVSRENILAPNELVAEVSVPALPPAARTTYAKVLDREAWTHAVVSVAALLELEEGRVQRVRVVLGGVAPVPWSVPAVADVLVGHEVTADRAAEAGRLAVADAQPLSKNRYKVDLTARLVAQTLTALAG